MLLCYTATAQINISIHALRGEGDVRYALTAAERDISIHALRGEGDARRALCGNRDKNFNPRPPWGGRPAADMSDLIRPNFNPRPPWGGRHYVEPTEPETATISIHALRGEGDPPVRVWFSGSQLFQSTPSVGRATQQDLYCAQKDQISIHALRGEGDDRCRGLAWINSDFNPRPPWGGRR